MMGDYQVRFRERVRLKRFALLDQYMMTIYGTYLTDMVGKRKCPDPVTQNQIKSLKRSLKKTSQVTGVRQGQSEK
jgi:hypothetical protein